MSAVGVSEKGPVKKIGALIAPLVRDMGMEEAVRFEEIRKRWDDIFDEPLSLHMSPSRLQKGELLINVDSPLWLQQLSFLKTQIVKNLSPFNIRDVRFRIGKAAGIRKRTDRHLPARPSPSLDGDDLQQIESTVSEIDDAAIKGSIRKLMEKSLAAKKRR